MGWLDEKTFAGMIGRALSTVVLSDDKSTITFLFADGYKAVFGVEGECCSHSWIEHIDVPKGIAGEKILAIEEATVACDFDEDECECLQVYKTTFRTAVGDIVLEYRNSSNGYYGGTLVRQSEVSL